MPTATHLKPAPKLHQQPRFSLNKLGEYLDATVTRRRSLVRDQKKPPGPGIVARYSHVITALVEYFEAPDPNFLIDRINKLETDMSGTEWQREDRKLSAEALAKLLEMLEHVNLTDAKVIPFPSKTPSTILVKGVKVSVRPDFLVVRQADDCVIGAIKLSHNKQHPLAKNGCESIAVVLQHYLMEVFPDAKVDSKRCWSMSTPLKSVVHSPKFYKARLAAVEAACEEIAARWHGA